MASKKKVVSLSVVTAIVLVLVIALSIVANSFSVYLDMWLGRGSQTDWTASTLTSKPLPTKKHGTTPLPSP